MINLQQVNLREKRILLRADLNVAVVNGEITSEQRILATVDTVKFALQENAGIFIISHFGRPAEGQVDERYSLAPIGDRLQEMLGQSVPFVRNWIDGVNIDPGEVKLGENVRFLHGELDCDPQLSRKLARLCDVFVMDAFAVAHRGHASTSGVAKFSPSACLGLQCQKEIEFLNAALKHPAKPVVAVVGGAKIDGKLQALRRLSKLAQTLIVGGGIANTFLAARGIDVGRSLCEHDLVGQARDIMKVAEKNGCEIILPCDVIVAPSIQDRSQVECKPVTQVAKQDMIFDFGPKTCQQFEKIFTDAKTVIWNGPLGAFEFPPFDAGTRAMTFAIVESDAFSVAGGGDTLSALERFGSLEGVSYASTGGGAFLEFVQGNELPGLAALERHDKHCAMQYSQAG